MTPEYAIEVKDLWFFYGDALVLQGASFSLQRGDFLGIIGPNGGGKTTLLRLLLGILKPAAGELRVLGTSPSDARDRIGYVPQHIHTNLSFPISVMQLVLMGRISRSHIGPWYSKKDRIRVEESLKMVGMWDHRNASVMELSVGQRQRVFIARALASDPEMLFLDEPTASVDPDFETSIYDLFKELNKNVTIVVVTHDIGAISRYVKSVACVNRDLIFHGEGKITPDMVKMAYQCPVDLIAHGVPHRVFSQHEDK